MPAAWPERDHAASSFIMRRWFSVVPAHTPSSSWSSANARHGPPPDSRSRGWTQRAAIAPLEPSRFVIASSGKAGPRARLGDAARAWDDAIRDIRRDPQLRAWLWQQAETVDDEYQRQLEVLDAAELELAGGHIAYVNHDELDPSVGWQASLPVRVGPT